MPFRNAHFGFKNELKLLEIRTSVSINLLPKSVKKQMLLLVVHTDDKASAVCAVKRGVGNNRTDDVRVT